MFLLARGGVREPRRREVQHHRADTHLHRPGRQGIFLHVVHEDPAEQSAEACPLSTMEDLYRIVAESDKVITL